MNQKGLSPILIVLILAALVGGYLVYQNQPKPTPSPQPNVQPSPTPDAEGKFCGGIAANLPENQCPSGYKCLPDGNYPDAGGKCVKE